MVHKQELRQTECKVLGEKKRGEEKISALLWEKFKHGLVFVCVEQCPEALRERADRRSFCPSA